MGTWDGRKWLLQGLSTVVSCFQSLWGPLGDCGKLPQNRPTTGRRSWGIYTRTPNPQRSRGSPNPRTQGHFQPIPWLAQHLPLRPEHTSGRDTHLSYRRTVCLQETSWDWQWGQRGLPTTFATCIATLYSCWRKSWRIIWIKCSTCQAHKSEPINNNCCGYYCYFFI